MDMLKGPPRPKPNRVATAPIPRLSASGKRLAVIPEGAKLPGSGAGFKNTQKLTNPAAKAQRTSKTSQKLVVLPSEPQKRPLTDNEELPEPSTGAEDLRSEGERMTKDQRRKAGYKRLTAYCVADGIKPKLTTVFLKREHGVAPRVYDDAIYVMYHLPLLPGYVSGVNVRSSTAQSQGREDHLGDLTEAEENGYDGTYFSEPEEAAPSTPFEEHHPQAHHIPDSYSEPSPDIPTPKLKPVIKPFSGRKRGVSVHNMAEVVIFTYGVAVFFGFQVEQEQAILEDLDAAGAFTKKFKESDWEIEECHFEHNAAASKPRIYNDFFTLKSHSHLLKLSISHALGQSTLLARYESLTRTSLSDKHTLAIPRQLAATGKIRMRRREAMMLTGRLFRLKRDVNLVSNVLDVPELFWSEASLGDLYDAIRDYFEISERVEELNRKLGVVRDLLDMIHEHLNGNAMVRITWIIIWLIVVAIVVELGEALARVVVHASKGQDSTPVLKVMSRSEVLGVLDRIAKGTGL